MNEAETLFRNTIGLLRSGDSRAASLLPELERFADYGPGWLALGAFLQDAGHFDAALSALGRAGAALPDNATVPHRMGQCLNATGRRKAAIAAFRHAVDADQGFAEGWYSLALALQDDGMHDLAVHAYRRALLARPDFHEAALNLGVALQENGALQPAMDAYALALHLRPQSFARIAQALTSGRTGVLWLDPEALRRHLVGRHIHGHPVTIP